MEFDLFSFFRQRQQKMYIFLPKGVFMVKIKHLPFPPLTLVNTLKSFFHRLKVEKS